MCEINVYALVSPDQYICMYMCVLRDQYVNICVFRETYIYMYVHMYEIRVINMYVYESLNQYTYLLYVYAL